jgi:protein ImuB
MFSVRKTGRGRQAQRLFPVPAEKAPVSCELAADKQRLWLCIHLPALAVDALSGAEASQPVVVYRESAGRAIIHACNRAAFERGIRPAATVAAARALCKELRACPHEPVAEQRLLHRLARWALEFSSDVSLYATNAVMLEIRGSLRLFGGMKALINRIEAGLEQRTTCHRLGVTPAPRAAFWLAQNGSQTIVTNVDRLAGAVRMLPIERMDIDRKQRVRLERSGIRTVGDLLRLPRDGLARRFGTDLMKQLDQALARESEPMPAYRPTERFSAEHEFYAPTSDLGLIKPAVLDLLRQLELFLTERQAATQQIDCLFAYEKEAATVVDVGCRRSIRSADAFAALLNTHLDRLRLKAEVVAVTIRCRRIERCVAEQLDLFERTPAAEHGWQQLLARMEARLGRYSLQCLGLQADHRPEKAGGCGLKPNGSLPTARVERPLWLLDDAEPLSVSRNNPCWHGSLRLEAAVERIEHGWWDDNDVSRDYRVARSKDGAKLWLYRDRRCRRWFLHGLFG